MPRVVSKSKKHLHYAGLSRSTLRAYENAYNSFLFVHKMDSIATLKPSHLDKLVGEHLNSMFQDGEPMSYAGHLLSALRRFHPELKYKLPISGQYHKNWCKTYLPARAVPASFPLVEAIIGYAVTHGDVRFAALMGLGFDAMLRTSE